MTNEDVNLMEGDIITEENLDEGNKNTEAKQARLDTNSTEDPKMNPNTLKKKPLHAKLPKLITIFIIFVLLITSFTILAVISSKIPQEKIEDPDIFVTSPKPTAIISEELRQVYNRIDEYENKLRGLETSLKDYPPPKVDFALKF